VSRKCCAHCQCWEHQHAASKAKDCNRSPHQRLYELHAQRLANLQEKIELKETEEGPDYEAIAQKKAEDAERIGEIMERLEEEAALAKQKREEKKQAEEDALARAERKKEYLKQLNEEEFGGAREAAKEFAAKRKQDKIDEKRRQKEEKKERA